MDQLLARLAHTDREALGVIKELIAQNEALERERQRGAAWRWLLDLPQCTFQPQVIFRIRPGTAKNPPFIQLSIKHPGQPNRVKGTGFTLHQVVEQARNVLVSVGIDVPEINEYDISEDTLQAEQKGETDERDLENLEVNG